MSLSIFSARVLVLAAYLMAAFLPVLAANGGLPLPDGQHAQMMASAGHAMPMDSAMPSDDDAQMLMCQQHCMLVPVTMPVQVSPAENRIVTSDIVLVADWLVASLATPPPGPPPKVAAI